RMKRITNTVFIALFLTLSLVAGNAFQLRAQKQLPETYIEQYKEAALHYMEEYGCPASIILAIALHESAYGTSRVARHLNNHFGIKGPNNSKVIRSAYKGYDSIAESYADFVGLLKRRKRTQQLFDQYQPHEYEKWVRGIARSGYAHSPSWSSKVISIIRKYNLNELDAQSEGGVASTSVDESGQPDEIYTVKQGDTLYDIAKKYGTTVQLLKHNN